MIFQFGADLFYANVGRFVANVHGLVEGADPRVKWPVVDAGAITRIDYSAARVLADLQQESPLDSKPISNFAFANCLVPMLVRIRIQRWGLAVRALVPARAPRNEEFTT